MKRETIMSGVTIAVRTFFAIFLAYFVASVSSTFVAMILMDSTKSPASGPSINPDSIQGRTISAMNYREMIKAVKKRNIFNSKGEFPKEADPSEAAKQGLAVFDENSPCSKPTVDVELLGTIYLAKTSRSLATMKDKTYSEADIYREGDFIVGNESAKIHRIEQNRVVLNNNGVKECIELAAPKLPNQENDDIAGAEGGGPGPDSAGDPAEKGCSNVVLEETYVNQELGEGMATILQKGRLIPHNVENAMVGFKLIGVDSNSLFGKLCLKNGDVVTQVNDTSLQQPDQGFAFYQAFQDEKAIRINVLKKGKDPATVNVQIK